MEREWRYSAEQIARNKQGNLLSINVILCNCNYWQEVPGSA